MRKLDHTDREFALGGISAAANAVLMVYMHDGSPELIEHMSYDLKRRISNEMQSVSHDFLRHLDGTELARTVIFLVDGYVPEYSSPITETVVKRA